MRYFRIINLICFLATTTVSLIHAQKFLPDDPVWTDHDRIPFPEPQFVGLSPSFDLAENTFGSEGKGPPVRASNVNTLGEVPNSSWFTNRLGTEKTSIAKLILGGLEDTPETSGLVTVTGAALIALTEGLVIRDNRNNLYYVKFDPVGLPNMASAADNITSKFLYAFGYNVLPTCIAYLDPSQMQLAPSAVVRMLGGKESPLDQEFVDFVLEQAHPEEDGRYRVVAHPLPPGKLLGGFKFFGTRRDDANDIFPHEDRRELRGLRIFAAWLNHVYCRALNTMDVFIREAQGEEALGSVKHYLVDFSTSLGSGYDLNERIVAKEPQSGYEYTFWGNRRANLKTALTLGIWERPWMKIKYPYPKYAEIGRIESEYFEPSKWKPDYSNAAFDRMLPDDAFWACEKLACLSDDAIRAVVHEGQFSNPHSEKYLADVLISRRGRILRHYFQQINPLARFEIVDSTLIFENLGHESGLAFETSYQYHWYAYDNEEGKLTPIADWRYTGLTKLPVPDHSSDYLMVRIRTRADEAPGWLKNVDVYLRVGDPLDIVGIDRELGIPELDHPAETVVSRNHKNR